MARRTAIAPLALAAALVAGPALAAESPPDTAAWVAANTDIATAQVVLVTPDLVYSLEASGPRTATGETVVLVRTEAFAIKPAGELQSWEAHVLADCRGGRVRTVHSAGYHARNRRGPPVEADAGGWVTPTPGQPASTLLAAACDPDFAWPLRTRIAAAEAPTILAMARTHDLPPVEIVKPSDVAAAIPAPSAAAPAPQATPMPEAYAIQVARGPSPEGARRALSEARKALGPAAADLSDATEHSKAGVLDRYSATLRGFASEADAGKACETLRAAARDCFVRALHTEPPPAPIPPAIDYVVQLAQGPSEEGAALAIHRSRKALGSQAAKLKGVTERRGPDAYVAVLSGFETAGAAARACKALQQAQLTCFARPAEQLELASLP